ncbi:MAG: hypothetical protein KJ592_03110 [Nanoarchaeota archaeon]|nr:hypothetical protein [Nanoarchaeota archaeon]
MISTIQIRERVKEQLSMMKGRNQSYEDVILYLIKMREMCKQRDVEMIKKEAEEINRISGDIVGELGGVEDVRGEVVEW